MPKASPIAATVRERLHNCRCPIHGTPMTQIDECIQGQIAACRRHDCGIMLVVDRGSPAHRAVFGPRPSTPGQRATATGNVLALVPAVA
jgi:hypothetical protein